MGPYKIDFRSDTVTRPGAQMRAVMAAAEVGDDVFGDDPSVGALEGAVAARFGKSAGVFVASGTQCNLVALMAHCGRGDAFVAGREAHCVTYEQGGVAVLGSLMPLALPNQADGSILLDDIAGAMAPDNLHFAPVKLLTLENTIGGKVLGLDYLNRATNLARELGLKTHLDGARIFNASVRLGVDVKALSEGFDSVSVCLSKGLGAPVGSVLVGDDDLIRRARRHRKILGGGMRQAGILAAAGLYALENHVALLGHDHANAVALANGLARFDGLKVVMPQTNIVYVEVGQDRANALKTELGVHGIGITSSHGGRRHRWVTHLDISEDAVAVALGVVKNFYLAGSSEPILF
ncbi:MAG: low-specificity L-threonine aldolase [Alphaproteobacteria bacterium]|nr:low-specificity L-threonine aldolase [Alphaproteobacteria bacterium]